MNNNLTPGQKAAKTRKWRRASQLAHKTARNAKTFTKYFLGKLGYKCVSLDSKKGYEYIGVVDMVAIKRDVKDPDMLHITLFQIKGGSARVTMDEIRRLRKAVEKVKIYWNVAEKPDKKVQFLNEIH